MLKNGLKDKFYRARYRSNLDEEMHPVDKLDLYAKHLPDGFLCAGFSGDFLLVKKDLFCNVAKGYDEVNPGHRLGRQTFCDGEILYQFHKNGIVLELIEDVYFHIRHSKNTGYQSARYNMNGYDNKPNWGFIDYPRKQVNKALVIYHEKDN